MRKLFIIFILTFLHISSFAAIKQWDGTPEETNDWHTASNWSPSGVPVAADLCFITNNGTALISTSDVSVTYIYCGDTDGPGYLINSNRSLTISSRFWVGEQQAGSYIQNGDSAYTEIQAGFRICDGGPSTVTLNGGSITSAPACEIGRTSGCKGTINITSGDFYQTGNLNLGFNSGSTGEVIIAGGSINMGPSACWLMPRVSGAVGIFDIRGDAASINLNDLDCDVGGTATIKFLLDEPSGGVSTVACNNNVDLDNANVSVQYHISSNFTGTAGTKYDLITTPTAFQLNTAGFTFTNITDPYVDFTESVLTNDGGLDKIQIVLNENVGIQFRRGVNVKPVSNIRIKPYRNNRLKP